MAITFKDAQKRVLEALSLLDSETADALIGAPPDDYKKLIGGMDGAFQMLWTLAISNGLKTKPEVKKMAGQAQIAMLTLLHYAYALGAKHGSGK